MITIGKVKVIKETPTGRNVKFKDTSTGDTMTRGQFVKKINNGKYSDYHVRKVNGVNTPAANPNGNKKDNLG